MKKKAKLELLLNEIVYIDPPQKLSEILKRQIECLQIGRRLIGTKMKWEGKERIEAPVYKENRWRVKFTDGLVLNIDKAVFGSIKKGNKIEYFNFWE